MTAQRKDDRDYKMLEQARDAERDKSRIFSMMKAYVTSDTCSESVKEKINDKLNSYYSNMASTLDLAPIPVITGERGRLDLLSKVLGPNNRRILLRSSQQCRACLLGTSSTTRVSPRLM